MSSPDPTPPAHSPVQLHIERLVVDESLLSAGQSDTLQTTIETELARLVREEGLNATSSATVHSLPARNIQIPKQSRPTRLGNQIARSVYAALGAENNRPARDEPAGG
jgi:hypothetical protein